MIAPFFLPHQWRAEEAIAHAADDDPEAIIRLLRGVSRHATAISDALSQRYFSHAHGAVQAVGGMKIA
jgi:hypothetical protein